MSRFKDKRNIIEYRRRKKRRPIIYGMNFIHKLVMRGCLNNLPPSEWRRKYWNTKKRKLV